MGGTPTEIQAILTRPIPSQADLSALTRDYRSYALHTANPRNGEWLVDISEYGIAGQSYYSRPNTATGGPVEGVPSAIFLRESLAQLLADINTSLQQTGVVAELLGGKVELFVQEGWRSPETQAYLYETVFPELIRAQYPGISEADMRKRRSELIAVPRSRPDESPSPHETGAAVDITLRYVRPEMGYLPKSLVNMGRKRGSIGSVVVPDYYEHTGAASPVHAVAQRNRRVFYWVMRGALLPEGDSRLVCNPREYWHWSFGDQMWAALTQAPYAFYGAITPSN